MPRQHNDNRQYDHIDEDQQFLYKYVISFVHAHVASLLCCFLILLHCFFQIGGINPGIKIYLIGDDTIVKFKLFNVFKEDT